MAPVDPLWIDGATLDGLEIRRAETLNVMTNGTALGGRAGVIPGAGGLAVSVVGTTITVSAGAAWVHHTGQGMYRVALPDGAELTMDPAHATLPRTDLVYLRVWDNAVDASGLTEADAVYLAGTAASGTPPAPTPSGTQVYLPLATLSVPASGGGSPTVSHAVRPYTVAPGGILPDAAAAGYYAGQYRDDGTGLQRYDGSAWSYPQPLGIGKTLFARKTADTTITNDDTVNNDPHLTLAVEANAVYAMNGYLIYSTPTAGDLNLDWTAPSGATGSWATVGPPTDATTPSGDNADRVRFSETSLTAARSFGGLVSSSTKIALHLRGLLVTSATPGSYQLQWSQNSSDPAPATVYTHSWLMLQRVA